MRARCLHLRVCLAAVIAMAALHFFLRRPSPRSAPALPEESAPVRAAENLVDNACTFLRVRDARVSGDRIIVPGTTHSQSAPNAAQASPSPATAAASPVVVHVESLFRSSRARVEFVASAADAVDGGEDAGAGAACASVEERPTVLLNLTHFALKNLAHYTFDLMYPLYATIARVSADELGAAHDGDFGDGDLTARGQRPLLLIDRTAVDADMPNDAETRIERLQQVFRPLVDDIVTVSGNRSTAAWTAPGAACFRDLLLGMREQPLRKSDWNYITPSPGLVVAERAALLRGFSQLLRRHFEATCSHAVGLLSGKASARRGSEDGGSLAQQRLAPHAPHAVLLGRTSSRRRLLNAAHAAHRLNASHMVGLGDAPWCAQYAALHHSRRIVGMHGAEWSHLLSLREPRRAAAVEIFPPCARTVSFFGAVARHLGVQHHVYVVRNASAASYDDRYPTQRRCIEAAKAGGEGALDAHCCFDASVHLDDGELDNVDALLRQAPSRA